MKIGDLVKYKSRGIGGYLPETKLLTGVIVGFDEDRDPRILDPAATCGEAKVINVWRRSVVEVVYG